MSRNRHRWRSLLFVPADNSRQIEKASSRGADALILDLEDAVAPPGKPAARKGLPGVIDALAGQGAEILVRINSGVADLDADLDAAIRVGVQALVVPKVEDPADLRAIDARLTEAETARGLPVGGIGLVALIETPGAVFRLPDIATAPRLIGLALGSEDFALSLGVVPSAACLQLPCQMLALAAAAQGLMGFGLPHSIADFTHLDAYRAAAISAAAMGLTGGFCIHPAQLPIINDVFGVSATEVDWARGVLAAWEAAQRSGASVIALDGQMIDKPVVERAQAIVRPRVDRGLQPLERRMGSGGVDAPSPKGRCTRTESVQRPNLKPIAGSKPARMKPKAS